MVWQPARMGNMIHWERGLVCVPGWLTGRPAEPPLFGGGDQPYNKTRETEWHGPGPTTIGLLLRSVFAAVTVQTLL